MFILAIGLTYIPSLRRRTEKFGKKAAVQHFVKRYLTLIGIGVTMDGVNDILDGNTEPLNIVFIAVTALVLVLSILSLILKAAKAKAYKKTASLLGWVVCAFGVFGVTVAAVNAVMLAGGFTDESFGHWVVLHHIGFAGLVALPFALIDGKHATAVRFASGTGILALYAILHETNLPGDLFANNREMIDKVADGGFFGGFAWGAMLIIYLAFSDLYYSGRKKFCAGLGIFAVIAAAITFGVFKTLPAGTEGFAGAISSFLPINKGSVSPSYVTDAAFISLLCFLIVDMFNNFVCKFDVLAWWGKNPILMYCIEFAFIGGLNAAFEDFFEKAAVPAAVIIIAAVAVLLSAVAYILDKKKIIIKL